jgi:hypothetical protein
MSTTSSPELQRDVQRLLGRCMLRIQQYERLMKGILTNHELSGAIHQFEAQKVLRAERYSDKSLGTLVKSLFESYVVEEGTEPRVAKEPAEPESQISVSFRYQIQMSEERRAQTLAAIEELVAMRNDLVHHLIERFDVWSDEGCALASEYLLQCYDTVDARFSELRQWAESMENARALSASFARSDAFQDLIVNGIAPDGSFDWPNTGIVRVLRKAFADLCIDGWAQLERAKTWISSNHADQKPEKYNCRTWQQVVTESRQFDLQYRPNADGKKVAWYRARVSD